jgi:ribosomal protein L21
MAQGLIAAALGGFGKALSNIGEMEAKKQNEAKLRKELMDMESEEKLRLDDVMFQRKQNRAIPEAQTTAKANVAGQVTTIEERNRTNLPALEAQSKVTNIDAELAAMSKAGIYDKQAKAKYDALNAEIDAAEKSGYDVKEARRTANALKAKFDAEETAGIPKLQANRDATQRLENVRALVEKNVVKEEANLLAKQELAKVQAMTAQGVPEAEAKLLSAKWKAQKAQRDEAAAEKTQQEMNDLITKMQNPKYTKAERRQAVNKRVVSDSGTPKERVTTADLLRKLQVAEDELAEALGVSDKKKINEEIRLLTEMANSKKNPNLEAKQKLKDIEQLRANVKRRRDELQNWRDKPEDDKSGNDKKSGNGKNPSIESFNR